MFTKSFNEVGVSLSDVLAFAVVTLNQIDTIFGLAG